MDEIWRLAISVFVKYYGSAMSSEEGEDRQMRIKADVRKALDEGRPLIRCLYADDEIVPITDASGEEERCLDSLTLINAVLYSYVSRVKDAANKAVHLERAPGTLEVSYSPKPHHDGWYPFQIDRGTVSMFCPVPSHRRERLRRQIAVFKTLWDISSNLRGRRLHEILSDPLRIPRLPQ